MMVRGFIVLIAACVTSASAWAQGADSYPNPIGPDGRVMDGMHRIARALLEGRATIAALRLPVLPDPDYRDCRPDQLPY